MESLFFPMPAAPRGPSSLPCLRSTSPDEPPPAAAIDFSLIESQKENIKPNPAGRSAATLQALFVDAEAERVVAEGHERFRKEIEEADRRDREGEDMVQGTADVLDVYNRYIVFTIQHHPSTDAHLLPLLETTTRKFIDDARYVQDVRYLKMWVMYTRHIERKEEVWAFLESRDVGTRHAAFYEEWASAVEALGRRKKADEIYRLGINRKAAPHERLKSRHQAFLARIMVTSGQIPDDDPVLSLSSSTSRTPARSVLGQVAMSSSVSGATQLAPSTRLSKAPNGAKMEIFSDTQGSGSASTAAEPPSEWADFGTRDARRKENVVEATPWKGEMLPQSAAKHRIAPRTPKIEVFRENTDGDNGAVRAEDEVFSRVKQQPLSEAELLKSDPLRHYDLSVAPNGVNGGPAASGSSLPDPPSTRKPPRTARNTSTAFKTPWECPSDGPRVTSAAGKTELRRFDWDAVMRGGDEWSFEEVRARARGLFGKEWRGEVKGWEREWHLPGSTTPKPEAKRKPPSPTVNTKLANLEVAMMFDQTIHGNKTRRTASDDEDSDEDGSDEDEEIPVMTAPTPLPSRNAPAMLAPGAGMVPPTPTPAAGYVSQYRSGLPDLTSKENAAPASVNRPGRMNIFSGEEGQDENAVPGSASRPAKMNIFSETPAKATALVDRTPLGARSASAKPRAFGIMLDEHALESLVESTPSIRSRSNGSGGGNVFATPADGEKAPPRRLLSHAIPEEPEDVAEDDENDENILQQVIENAELVKLNDEDEDERGENEEQAMPRRRQGRFQIHEMTPITERTYEYTTHTMRSSALGHSTGPRRYSVRSEIEDEDEAIDGREDEARNHGATDLSAVNEEEEQRSRPNRSSSSPGETFPHFDSVESVAFDRSGSAEEPFKLADGFTIHEATSHTMMLVDRTATMHIGRNTSVEAEDRVETNEASAARIAVASVGAVADAGPANPCDPTDDAVRAHMLKLIEPAARDSAWFVDHRSDDAKRWEALQRHAKNRNRRGSTASRAPIGGEDHLMLDLAGNKYEVWDKIGEGGFGAVFLAVDVAARAAQDAKDDEDSDGDEEEDDCFVAIKVEQQSSVWEAIMLDRIHGRVDPVICASIVHPGKLFAFADESFLLLEYSHQGTLLDLVNKATQLSIAPAVGGGLVGVDELIAMFFVIELLKLIEGLHNAGIIHGDLKIDNCLVRLEPITASEGGSNGWSPQYSAEGDGGWSRKGVRLIDFGRSIDLSLFLARDAQRFIASWDVDERDCAEMRQGKEWSYQTDYHGLATIAHCLLFGKYVGEGLGEPGEDGRYRIGTPLKRYWQTSLWNRLFDALLNPTLIRADSSLPVTSELGVIRRDFESWLEENCQKGGKNLRVMLKKVETATISRRI